MEIVQALFHWHALFTIYARIFVTGSKLKTGLGFDKYFGGPNFKQAPNPAKDILIRNQHKYKYKRCLSFSIFVPELM